jgi:hypothetical protein
MRGQKWLAAIAAILAAGLVAAGCGGGDDTTTVLIGGDTSTAATESTTTSDESTTEDSGTSESTPDDVYNACIDAISGTPAESVGQAGCQQARDAFQRCLDQAGATSGSAGDTAAQLCQNAADQAIDTLKTASGG